MHTFVASQIRGLGNPSRKRKVVIVAASVVVVSAAAVLVHMLVRPKRPKRPGLPDLPLGHTPGDGVVDGTSQVPSEVDVEGEDVPIGGVIEVGKSGGTGDEAKDFELLRFEMDTAATLTIDVAASVYHPIAQRFYGAAGRQWCRGVRITLGAERTVLGLVLSNVETIDTSEPCLALVEPGKEDLQGPYPNGPTYGNLRPRIEPVVAGADLVLRVTAPGLTWGDEYIPPGQGRTVDWWEAHTGPWRYEMRVTGTMRIS